MLQNFLHTGDIFDQNLLEGRWRGVKGHLKLVHKLIRFVGGGLPLGTTSRTKSSVYLHVVQTPSLTLYTCTALQRVFEQYEEKKTDDSVLEVVP